MPSPRAGIRWSLCVTTLSLAVLTSPAGAQETKGTLAGNWKFNAEKTAELKKDLGTDKATFTREDRTRKQSRAAGAAAAAGVPNTGPPDLGPLQLYSKPQPVVTIVQTDSTISISDPRGTPRVYYLDGHKESEPLLSGESMEITAKWKDGKLTTERKLGSRGSVREIYSIQASGELYVEVRLSAPQLTPPMILHWVFDAAPGS